MAHDEAYLEAEKKIQQALRSGETKIDLSVGMVSRESKLSELPEILGEITQLNTLDISNNNLVEIPQWLGSLKNLEILNISHNKLTALPDWIDQLEQLKYLDVSHNLIETIPPSLVKLTNLRSLYISDNKLERLPEDFGYLIKLEKLDLSNNFLDTIPGSLNRLVHLHSLDFTHNRVKVLPILLENLPQLQSFRFFHNQLTDIPVSLIHFRNLDVLLSYGLEGNPFNPELTAAYKQGPDAVKIYLRAKAAAQITLNEAKLILVGEGEVGKSCLLSALRDEEFVEGLPTTHGIEIKQIKITDPESKKEITLNGWDFGGQRVYRPTHQLFFSSPAVYLVVWKPREGSQAGQIKEWIRLIKHREPTAKIIVVATHGGPNQRQPDIDRQELWDLFGKDTIIDFFHVDSKPDENGKRKNIEKLKQAIARVAISLPEVGRSVPKRWQEVREALQNTNQAYLPLEEVLELCRAHGMDNDESRLFITIEHRLGHLIHYEHDPALQDIVVLKPDWLATAISFVLDDEQTRNNHGLVSFSRLHQLWDGPHA